MKDLTKSRERTNSAEIALKIIAMMVKVAPRLRSPPGGGRPRGLGAEDAAMVSLGAKTDGELNVYGPRRYNMLLK